MIVFLDSRNMQLPLVTQVTYVMSVGEFYSRIIIHYMKDKGYEIFKMKTHTRQEIEEIAFITRKKMRVMYFSVYSMI